MVELGPARDAPGAARARRAGPPRLVARGPGAGRPSRRTNGCPPPPVAPWAVAAAPPACRGRGGAPGGGVGGRCPTRGRGRARGGARAQRRRASRSGRLTRSLSALRHRPRRSGLRRRRSSSSSRLHRAGPRALLPPPPLLLLALDRERLELLLGLLLLALDRRAPTPVAPASGARPVHMTASAVVSAARSKRSDGSETLMPPAVGVPSTGPERCWTTCVSSWASVRSWTASRASGPSPRTISLPTV